MQTKTVQKQVFTPGMPNSWYELNITHVSKSRWNLAALMNLERKLKINRRKKSILHPANNNNNNNNSNNELIDLSYIDSPSKIDNELEESTNQLTSKSIYSLADTTTSKTNFNQTSYSQLPSTTPTKVIFGNPTSKPILVNSQNSSIKNTINYFEFQQKNKIDHNETLNKLLKTNKKKGIIKTISSFTNLNDEIKSSRNDYESPDGVFNNNYSNRINHFFPKIESKTPITALTASNNRIIKTATTTTLALVPKNTVNSMRHDNNENTKRLAEFVNNNEAILNQTKIEANKVETVETDSNDYDQVTNIDDISLINYKQNKIDNEKQLNDLNVDSVFEDVRKLVEPPRSPINKRNFKTFLEPQAKSSLLSFQTSSLNNLLASSTSTLVNSSTRKLPTLRSINLNDDNREKKYLERYANVLPESLTSSLASFAATVTNANNNTMKNSHASLVSKVHAISSEYINNSIILQHRRLKSAKGPSRPVLAQSINNVEYIEDEDEDDANNYVKSMLTLNDENDDSSYAYTTLEFHKEPVIRKRVHFVRT